MNTAEQNPADRQSDPVCPFLGLSDDPATALSFPSILNYCIRARPVEAPSLEHQRAFCLTPRHLQCPLFEREEVSSMPAELRARREGSRRRGGNLPKVVVGGIIVLAILLTGWQIVSRVLYTSSPEIPTAAPRPIFPTPPLDAGPSDTLPLEATPTALPSRTPAVTPSNTSMVRRQLSLDVPLGLKNQFLVHRVAEGEGLELLANRYATTVEAIRAVNYQIRSPVWAGDVIVVPLQPDEIQGFPSFEPYEIREENVTLPVLAQRLAIEASSLAYYNALYIGYIFTLGDWVLIPRPRP